MPSTKAGVHIVFLAHVFCWSLTIVFCELQNGCTARSNPNRTRPVDILHIHSRQKTAVSSCSHSNRLPNPSTYPPNRLTNHVTCSFQLRASVDRFSPHLRLLGAGPAQCRRMRRSQRGAVGGEATGTDHHGTPR